MTAVMGILLQSLDLNLFFHENLIQFGNLGFTVADSLSTLLVLLGIFIFRALIIIDWLVLYFIILNHESLEFLL